MNMMRYIWSRSDEDTRKTEYQDEGNQKIRISEKKQISVLLVLIPRYPDVHFLIP